jgi:hypothetical protein
MSIAQGHLLAFTVSRWNKPYYFTHEIAPQKSSNESLMLRAKTAQELPARLFGLTLD